MSKGIRGYPSVVGRMSGDGIFRTTLPPGRHRLPADFVARHQRDRLSAAIVELVDEQGYPATSLTQIVKRASVACRTFHEHYEDKEALFLAVFDAATERAIRIAREGGESAPPPWESQIRAGLKALLADVAKNPMLARVCLTEALGASPTTLAHYESALHRFAAMLRTGRTSVSHRAELPESLEDIVVGGAAWMLNRQLIREPAAVEEVLPGMLEFVLVPYLGEPAAHFAAQPVS